MTGETKPCTSKGEMSNQAEETADAKELRHRVLSVCEEQQRDQSLWNRLGGWSGQWRSQKAEGVGSCRLPSLHKDLQTEEKEPRQSFKERSSLI